ncbi:hypothetical protein H5410_004204 [Solanum commersonii]|uniref:Uncharacterized protein n=1 Tax=Solanum commersonii TaxID=4109 RepID=A0A9J6B7T4_SOLCO|nr:hypothetical protein H5410_004204 [Solanum commersonii]
MDSRDASILEACVHNVIVSSLAKENSQLVKTQMEWPIFVDLQLGSPPLAVEGKKYNNAPNLLSDDEYSERTVKLMGRIFFKMLIFLRMCILDLIVEGKEGWWILLEKEEWEKEIDNLCVDMHMRILEVQIGLTNSPILPMQSEKMFPKCLLVIIAPSSLLLSLEAEFQKLEVDIPLYIEE